MISKLGIFLFMAISLTALVHADLPINKSSEITGPWDIDVMLRSSIYLPTPRPVQDVYVVLNDTTPEMVYRIERSQADDQMILSKEAYGNAMATPHDPYKISPNPLGPFPKGADLGFALGEWLEAIGTGTYSEENDNATLNLTFRKLVPNGTYTVWYYRIAMPPNFGEAYIPIGAADGSQNVFKADADGNATFDMKLRALPSSTNVTFKDYAAMYVTKTAPITANITWTLISVAYHSDGLTHGAVPGELGKTTHFQLVHLMYPKPARTYQEWQNMSSVRAEASSNKTAEKQPGFDAVLAIAGLLAVASLALKGSAR